MRSLVGLLALVLAIRVAFLGHAVQGDDYYYLAIGQHTLIDPARPNHFTLETSEQPVDMRGFTHPPGNGMVLGGLLALASDVREPLFHAVYALFSLVAVAAMWSMARRFGTRPGLATLLFAATPAFVINGNSLESDIPFLAFALAGAAFWIHGVDQRRRLLMAIACLSAAAASMTSYQGVLLAPLFAGYLWLQRPVRRGWWIAAAAPAVTIALWQLWLRASTGTAPAEVLTGYMPLLQTLQNKLLNAASLTAHLGWMLSPVLAAVAFGGRWSFALAAACGAAAAISWEPHPLFVIPFATGILVLIGARERGLPRAWLVAFFAFAATVFYAGSARYLLPLAAPLSILASNRLAARERLACGLATVHLALGLALAAANAGHWHGYRELVARHSRVFDNGRVWVAAEHGLRHYAERAGGVLLTREAALRPGDTVISSQLSGMPEPSVGGGQLVSLAEYRVRPSIPLRLFALHSRAGYSSAARGLRVFDINDSGADVVTVRRVLERAPTLTSLAMNAPEAQWQIVSGVYQLEDGAWRWAGPEAVLLLKSPESPRPVRAVFRILKPAEVSLRADGREVARKRFTEAGNHELVSEVPVATGGGSTTISVHAPRIPSPGDQRELALILLSVGFE